MILIICKFIRFRDFYFDQYSHRELSKAIAMPWFLHSSYIIPTPMNELYQVYKMLIYSIFIIEIIKTLYLPVYQYLPDESNFISQVLTTNSFDWDRLGSKHYIW